MIIASVEQKHPVAFTTQEGRCVHLGIGSIVGSYLAVSHSGTRRPNPDRERPHANRKHLEITFATADDLGDVYVYLSLLTLRTLWPVEGEKIRHDPEFFDFSEASLRNVELDGSSFPALRVERPDGVMKRTWTGTLRAGLQCRCEKWGLEVSLSIHSGDPYDLNLAYKIPLERLLWRPYAVFTDDNVFGETADYVWFKKTEPLSDYDRRRGLCPGPIHVSQGRLG